MATSSAQFDCKRAQRQGKHPRGAAPLPRHSVRHARALQRASLGHQCAASRVRSVAWRGAQRC